MDVPDVIRGLVAEELERERVIDTIKGEMRRAGLIASPDEEANMRRLLAALDAARSPREASQVAGAIRTLDAYSSRSSVNRSTQESQLTAD